jgi:hypothetical protein
MKILDGALDRFPGRYVPVKTWVMCFANTGAYFEVEAAGRAGSPTRR